MSDPQRIYRRVPCSNCRGLCAESCGPILVFPNEPIVAVTPSEHQTKQHNWIMLYDTERECCPHLRDGKCSQYEVRPLVCRMWGSVVDMPCVFGCRPDRYLGQEEGARLLRAVSRLEKSPDHSPSNVGASPEVSQNER